MERITFVGDFLFNAGSGQTIVQYAKEAKRAGVEVAVSGYVDDVIAKKVPIIKEVNEKNSDKFVFVFENLMYLDPVRYPGRLEHFLKNTRRENRVVIDTDGKYGRYKPTDPGVSSNESAWDSTINELSDVVLQPSFKLVADNVISFPFYGFPDCVNYKSQIRKFDMVYVGNNWFRESTMIDFLNAAVDSGVIHNIQIKGKSWDKYRLYLGIYGSEKTPQSSLNINIKNFGVSEKILSAMSKGEIHPILFHNILLLREMVTPRMLETFAADTIPLFFTDFDYYQKIYGDGGDWFCASPENMKDKIHDAIRNKNEFIKRRNSIRKYLASTHSYGKRLGDLKSILEIK